MLGVIAQNSTEALSLKAGQVIMGTGSGTAVYGPGVFLGQPVTFQGRLLIGPLDFDVTVYVSATSVTRYNIVEMVSSPGFLVDPVTGQFVGAQLPNGQVQYFSNFYDSNAPSQYYYGGYRGAQTDFGPLIDQSPEEHDAVLNAALFPAAWTATTAITTGQYRSPLAPNGLLYRATTGGTTGGTQPTWNTTIGGTTTDGTVTWTTERGPWFVDSGGVRQFRSILNSQIGAAGSFSLGNIGWNMAAGDSIIVSITGLQNYTSGPSNFNESQVCGNRVGAGLPGVTMVATGQTSFNDLRFRLTDGTTTRTVAHLSSGAPNKPGDGNRRTSTFFVDGVTKRLYYCADGVPRNTPSDYTGVSATDIIAWDADVSAVSGNTSAPTPFVFGGLPAAGGTLATTTWEFAASRFDILVLPSRGLPSDIVSIAQWFHNRGETLLPRGLLP